jgi:hypothetical protein
MPTAPRAGAHRGGGDGGRAGRHGYEVVVVDITTDDIRDVGFNAGA